jgi:hypothetical protein
MFLLIDNELIVYSVKCCLSEHDPSEAHISKNVKMKYMTGKEIYVIPIQYMWNSQSDILTLTAAEFIPYDKITHKLHKTIYADSYNDEKGVYVTNIKICKQHIEWINKHNDIPEHETIYDFLEFRWK